MNSSKFSKINRLLAKGDEELALLMRSVSKICGIDVKSIKVLDKLYSLSSEVRDLIKDRLSVDMIAAPAEVIEAAGGDKELAERYMEYLKDVKKCRSKYLEEEKKLIASYNDSLKAIDDRRKTELELISRSAENEIVSLHKIMSITYDDVPLTERLAIELDLDKIDDRDQRSKIGKEKRLMAVAKLRRKRL